MFQLQIDKIHFYKNKHITLSKNLKHYFLKLITQQKDKLNEILHIAMTRNYYS